MMLRDEIPGGHTALPIQSKDAERQRINQDVQDFLNRGGEITVVEPAQSCNEDIFAMALAWTSKGHRHNAHKAMVNKLINSASYRQTVTAEWLPASKACLYLGLNDNAFRRAVNRGTVAGARAPRQTRRGGQMGFLVADLDAWIKAFVGDQ